MSAPLAAAADWTNAAVLLLLWIGLFATIGGLLMIVAAERPRRAVLAPAAVIIAAGLALALAAIGING